MKDKKITQETFDSAVKENVEDFGMDIEAALQDTIKQFEALGVDLSNIVTSLPAEPKSSFESDTVRSPTEKAKALVAELDCSLEEAGSPDSVTCILNEIIAECDVEITNRVLLANVGAAPAIISACRHPSPAVSLHAFGALAALTNGQPDVITPTDIAFLLDKCRSAADDASELAAVFGVVRNCCLKHEANRQEFVELGLIEVLLQAVSKHRAVPDLIKSAAATLRLLTLDDDVRVPYGRGHEHAKMIVSDHGGIKILLGIAPEFASDPAVITALFLALSSLAVRNEFCQQVVDANGLQLILKVLLENIKSQGVVQSGLMMLKAIAGNDAVKDEIVKAGGIEVVLNIMNKHQAIVRVCLAGCACLAALALRSPNNSQKIVEAGGADCIVTVIKVHKDDIAVQKSAYRAITNLVNRVKQYAQTFLDLGIESLIKEACGKRKELESQAASTLTVLGCNVLLKEPWTGEKGSLQN